ncbi:hypothetical protein Slin15195_G091250 [Septoria linicola]|uniref:Rhodopsin domain-containing protein n=1 Tax=Septoria linicola TaxID=215465 RepID=A0A9Q9B219_9PEZI|nr:hypothetical protein Slin15195_G091250 [Septoria linicola]
MKSNGHAPSSVVIGVISTFSILSYICVALRLWTRFRIHRQPGVDDALIVVSTIFVSPPSGKQGAISMLNECPEHRHVSVDVLARQVMTRRVDRPLPYGLSQHIQDISPDHLQKMMFWFWLSIWNYYGAQGFAKLSILFQYLRIFGHVRSFRLTCYGVIALSGFYTAWGIITSMLICVPIPGFWHLAWQTNGKAKCMPMWRVKVPIWFFNAALNMTTDILIAGIPIPVIKTLNLPRKQRYMLMGVFCLGGLVCIISIVRLSGLYAIAVSHDPSYDNCLAALWSATEASLTAIASCLPVLKGFMNKHFPRLFKGTSSGTADRYASNLSGATHSRLKDTDTIGSSGRRVWAKKSTTIQIEEAESDSPKSEAWGWSEEGQGPQAGAIQMHTIVERTSSKKKPMRKKSDESGEALVPVAPSERP